MGPSATEHLGAALLAAGDALWPGGEEGGARPRSRRLYPTVALAIVVVLVLRRLDAVTNPQFWAEDGTIFFQQNLVLGFWGAVREYYRGFPYLAQRLIAFAATPVPFAEAPLAYNLMAYVVAAASLATFVLPWFRHVVRSDGLRVLLCLAVAGAAQANELVANVTNTSWFLGVWLVLMTIARLPRAALARAGLSVAIALATFSTPLVVLTAPLWIGRALHAVRRGRRDDLGIVAVALASVLALVAVAGTLGREEGSLDGLGHATLNLLSLRLLVDAALGERTIDGAATRLGGWVVHATALGVVAALAALATAASRRQRPVLPVLLVCAYGIAAASVQPLVGHPLLLVVAPSLAQMIELRAWVSGRYLVLPVALLYLAVVACVDRLPPRRQAVAAWALVAWLVASQAPTFVLAPFRDLQWRTEAARLERKFAERFPDPVRIPINPDVGGFGAFAILIDGRTPAPEVKVRPLAVFGPLLSGTIFEQSFVARCANLSEVAVMFTRTGSAAGQTLQILLVREDTRRPVAGLVRNGAAVVTRDPDLEARVAALARTTRERGLWLTDEQVRSIAATSLQMEHLYFPPVRDSEGKRYVIAIAATGGTADDGVSVYTSAGEAYGEDAYPDGEARHDRRSLGRDLVFRYGCSPG